MSNYKIEKIGKASQHISKKGFKTLKLEFNKDVFGRISQKDFENGIYIMLYSGVETLDIICPMPKKDDL